MDWNSIICGDCAKVLAGFPADYIDLTVTSPPYDNLREYNGYVFDFEPIAQQLYRVTKPGGVVVWVVGDATVNGSETGTSFRQALHFMGLGFNLHDTMIYQRKNTPLSHNRYEQEFEFMFILVKPGNAIVFNLIMQQTLNPGKIYKKRSGRHREINGHQSTILGEWQQKNQRIKGNIWFFYSGNKQNGDYISHTHPAIFPEALARDHIISWSNPGDLILDPMCGSGTTLKMAKELGRQYIGIDISQEYCDLSQRRVEGAKVPLFVLPPEPNGKAEPEQLELIA